MSNCNIPDKNHGSYKLSFFSLFTRKLHGGVIYVCAISVRMQNFPSSKKERKTECHVIIHWRVEDWQSIRDTETVDTGLGVHVAELEIRSLVSGQRINFTNRHSNTAI